MSGPIELSVVIVSFECRDMLLDCLASLELQRAEIALEVLVVDNASTDGTLDAIARSHPWVDARPAGGNLGFAKANNMALGRVTGDFVLLLNPDTVVPAGALRRCVDALAQRPGTGMLGCKLIQADGQLDHACKRGFPTIGASLAYFSGLQKLAPRSARFAAYTAGHVGPDETALVDAVNGAFMLARREAARAVGPLDEDFWMYGEDLDWCLRFWRSGWPILYWPEVTVLHVKGGSTTSMRSWRSNRAFHEAMWIFHRKHYAADHPRWANALVHAGIASKLLVSAGRNWSRRRLTRRDQPGLTKRRHG